MVNSEDFIKRLELILDYYSLSASGFADKIDVQRSSLSHLLSGRNKPSLDFILKIIAVFPEVDLYWILNGKGNFPKSESNSTQQVAQKVNTAPTPKFAIGDNLFTTNIDSDIKNNGDSDNIEILENNQNTTIKNNLKSSNIERIVIFYLDGTFSEYCPK